MISGRTRNDTSPKSPSSAVPRLTTTRGNPKCQTLEERRTDESSEYRASPRNKTHDDAFNRILTRSCPGTVTRLIALSNLHNNNVSVGFCKDPFPGGGLA